MTGEIDPPSVVDGTAAPSRRRALAGLAALVPGAALLAASGHAFAQTPPAIVPPTSRTRDAFMSRAIALRDQAAQGGDQPFGAVVVKDGAIVGEGPSRVVINNDPTAHSEIEAIRDAARRLATRILAGCEIYASSRPCPMCEAAAYWAGIGRIFHGAEAADTGSPRLTRC